MFPGGSQGKHGKGEDKDVPQDVIDAVPCETNTPQLTKEQAETGFWVIVGRVLIWLGQRAKEIIQLLPQFI